MTSKCRSSDILPQNLSAGSTMLESNISKSPQDSTVKSASCGSVSVFFPISMMVTGMILMLKMISTHTSSHHCKSAAASFPPNQDLQMDCNFFLTAIRLASLNQILDPWVYLLLREILLRKFCQVASAVSKCSLEGQKEIQCPLDVLNKKAIQNDQNVQKQSLNVENCNLSGGNGEQ
ncbi:uncharacterized protein ptger3 isoform X2 [Paramisgurnus dabryanus]|uniref:uncharacterized protein ptger3 isoform X2 n=1 Tax=Paramisgurnus dabryanus TaxID=90735 RepID=UPI0031F3C9A5